jgi:hypothetical protein
MNAHTAPSSDPASDRAFAIKLFAADPRDPGSLAGRVEHVLSGRRHNFGDGQALLACLAREQQLAAHGTVACGRSQAGDQESEVPHPMHGMSSGRSQP